MDFRTELAKRGYNKGNSVDVEILINEILPELFSKQETLEEAAEIWINNRFTKQICGDKSYPDIYASKKSIIESHIIFAKSQGKIMYSEEEVHKILCKSHNAESTSIIANTLKKWLEQFKKK